MAQRKARQVWIEQCEAAKAVKARFELKAAFDFVGEQRLMDGLRDGFYQNLQRQGT